jgi:hypothetical protein
MMLHGAPLLAALLAPAVAFGAESGVGFHLL